MRNDRPHRKVVDFIMSHTYPVKRAGCKDKCEIEGSHMVGWPCQGKALFLSSRGKSTLSPIFWVFPGAEAVTISDCISHLEL